MDNSIIYVPGFDGIEVPGNGDEAVLLTRGQQPKVGDTAEVKDLDGWQVVHVEVYTAKSGDAVYIAAIAPNDKVDAYLDSESIFAQLKGDYPDLALSLSFSPDKELINYEWDVRGEAPSGRLFAGIYGPTGEPITVYSNWEVMHVETFCPHSDQPLFKQVHFCYCSSLALSPELISA